MKKQFSILALLLVIALALSGCAWTEPRPEIKNGEFDFSVTYTYAGQTQTVSGVFACEYAGMQWALDGGYDRDWTGDIKGDEIDDYILIDTVDGHEILLVLNLIPEYFMDDFNFDLYDVPAPYIRVDYTDEEGEHSIYDVDVIEENYGAKIVSYEYDAPIENNFGIFK